jgi:CubicO group peptidase (beta-lactamase class C family)
MQGEGATSEQLDALRMWLEEKLPALAAADAVPGAVVAVLSGDRVVEVSTGVLNRRTDAAVTADSVFQLGSVTKMWTATLAMQLVDEGFVDLDAPVRTYLPSFRLADERAAARITTRHLLSHTGGFYGELEWSASAQGADAVRQYVDEVMPVLPQLFEPGRMFAYTNAGMVVLARLVEVMRNLPWARALRSYLTEPLGVEGVATCADEAILYNAAVGHNDERQPVSSWSDGCDANLPVGGLAMSARDLLALARLHLNGGTAPDGHRLLAQTTVRAMQVPQVTHPRRFPYEVRTGLGWFLPEWPGGPVLEHSGSGIGQSAWLRLVPDRRLALVILANVDSSDQATNLDRPRPPHGTCPPARHLPGREPATGRRARLRLRPRRPRPAVGREPAGHRKPQLGLVNDDERHQCR